MKRFNKDIEQAQNEICEYRTNQAESDWEEGIQACGTIEYYGLFNQRRRSIVDKKKLYDFLVDKHWYWGGDFGYFRDHWDYWFVYKPTMKDNPYFGLIPFPAEGLLLPTQQSIEVYKKYWDF